MRKRIAQHMVESKRTSAHVTTVFEVDFTNVEKLRRQYKDSYAERGTKLTYLPFIVQSVIAALREFPIVNASMDENSVIYHRDLNIGIAVALEWGLIVPVVKNADEKNVLGLARVINDLGERARTKKLSPDEVQGGTFTITNPGIYGGLFGTPIINQPQVATLVLYAQLVFKPPVKIGVTGDGKVRSAAVPIPFPAANEKWVRIVTPRFDIVSAANDYRTRDVARDLETLATALHELQPDSHTAPPRTRIVIFNRRSEAQPYFDVLMEREKSKVGGLFIGSNDRGVMLIDGSPS